jgi:hypothetical protein
MTDLKVKTPIGWGTFMLARFQQRKEMVYMVRIPLTDENRPHLADKNCMTKKAKKEAIFYFTPEELGLPKGDW